MSLVQIQLPQRLKDESPMGKMPLEPREYKSKQDEALHYRQSCLGSLRAFTQMFYTARTGRKFELSDPIGRPSHYSQIFQALTKVQRGEIKRLIINVPPRYGKTESVIHFIAQGLALAPDSNYIYLSYSQTLAKRQTETVRDIIQLPLYRDLFGVALKEDSTSKADFKTNFGGAIYAAGSGGTVTGMGAGIKGVYDRTGGCIVIDDIHKPDEVSSDVIRNGIKDWYYNTLMSRLNSPNTPIVVIGQCLHEDDLIAHLKKDPEWTILTLAALDSCGNALHPQMHSRQTLLKMQEQSPYHFAAQYQQDPQPAGGGIFKPEWFREVDDDQYPTPADILATFVTIDTAETDKSYNDATVFSFWGLYRIKHGDTFTDEYALHWLDCRELRVEPKDLKPEFMQFYYECMRYPKKPRFIGIERKSTGVTLSSMLKELQGLNILDILRTKASGSKTARFLEAQQYVAQRRISLPRHGRHTSSVIEHCRKITANNTHMHDDIADTMYDAIKLALIDKLIIAQVDSSMDGTAGRVASIIMHRFNKASKLKDRAYERSIR
jgi:predicted phage terminase large subunit-like protein